ncbi:hypothetical protein B0J18DRAFT_421172 [Chaetomium sp. MPI-SDFR-AT-0129]|nr:hypothetical protein B0J18DRAFT_421172 [Chaetomium sp. MPI-SDFR-AT-0129]
MTLTDRQAVRKETSHTHKFPVFRISHTPPLSVCVTLPSWVACLFFLFLGSPHFGQHARGDRPAGHVRLRVLPRGLASGSQLRCGGVHPATLAILPLICLSLSPPGKISYDVRWRGRAEMRTSSEKKKRLEGKARGPSKPWGNEPWPVTVRSLSLWIAQPDRALRARRRLPRSPKQIHISGFLAFPLFVEGDLFMVKCVCTVGLSFFGLPTAPGKPKRNNHDNSLVNGQVTVLATPVGRPRLQDSGGRRRERPKLSLFLSMPKDRATCARSSSPPHPSWSVFLLQ